MFLSFRLLLFVALCFATSFIQFEIAFPRQLYHGAG